MLEWLPIALAALNLILLLWLLLRPREDGAERLARELRAEVQDSARGTRQELAQALALFQQALQAQQSDVARTQNEQIDSFRTQLATVQETIAAGQARAREAQDSALQRFGATQGERLQALAAANERALDALRGSVEQRLQAIQADNERKLEQMRATVDEKLQTTLQQRLGESFRQVAERLEQVHKGLGEMQGLAKDVGSLNRVLTNVKTRGIFGEVQLAGLLEQVFTPEQYATNIATVPGSRERVEFALRLPGLRDDGAPLWLPIDAKFPREDYERLLEAQDRADAAAAEISAKAIETRLRLEAKSMRAKYVAPPHTTEFAILFVPTEGLYAEALRRPGLVESLQREHRVTLAGPTTLLAMLNSLQMGFRTLALEKRSTEVWEVLGAVKTEFAKFASVLTRIRGQAQTVLNTVGDAETRTRQMNKALKGVEALPEAQAQALLPGVADDVPAADA